MIDGKKILAVITARGGSKNLPGKNIADAGGKPLITWTIEAAHGSKLIDRTVLSSDDEDIIAVARNAGCDVPFVRPVEMAGDASPVEEALIHALDEMDEPYDFIILLQPTSPLRVADDIDGAIRKCHSSGALACVAGCPSAKSPYLAFRLDGDDRLSPLIESESITQRRQDIPPTYVSNGAVFVAQVPWYREHRAFYGPDTVLYIMPQERSLDVDTALDLSVVRALLENAGGGDEKMFKGTDR